MSPDAMEAATDTPEQEAQELTDMFVDQGDQLPTPPSIQQQHMQAAIQLSHNIEETTGDDITPEEHIIIQDEPDIGLTTEQRRSGRDRKQTEQFDFTKAGLNDTALRKKPNITTSGQGGLITPKPKAIGAPPAVEGVASQDTTIKRNITEVNIASAQRATSL